MSKVATYLNEHLMGEIVLGGRDIKDNSTDGSVLLQQPEMVAHVANTSDIRKIFRFAWQLAEKGHALTLTPRGAGTDVTGAAIGSGVIVSMSKYMNRVIGIDPKQRLIHIQAGAPYRGVNMALSTHRGLTLPEESFDGGSGTIGGAISTGATGFMSSRYGTVGSSVEQLEVVLSNGDVLQTKRLTKRELSSKKGLHTMEGEVYRQLDNLITDNLELIESLSKGASHDTSGYRSIVDVKKKDGSFDLAPLFVGAQGSLGIITEVIMQAKFARPDLTVVTAAYKKMSDVQAAADEAVANKAVSVEIIDGQILARAAKLGKKRDFAPSDSFKGGLMVAIYDDFTERTRKRLANKLKQLLEKSGQSSKIVVSEYARSDLADIRSILSIASRSDRSSEVVPEIFSGIWLPSVQMDGFLGKLGKLEKEFGVKLPFYVDIKSGLVDLLPVFDMKKVSDRQKLVKLLNSLATLVHRSGGSLAGRGGDGRLKSLAINQVRDKEVRDFYAKIKHIFDPYNLLNTGVKQDASAKDLVAQLNAWCRNIN